MAHVTNVSKFKALAIEQSFYHGRRYDCLLLKATFRIGHDGKLLPLSGQPNFIVNDVYEPVDTAQAEHRQQVLGDEDIDEYAALSHPSEIIAYKPATDVIVIGHAAPPGGIAQTHWLANLRVATIDKTIKLTGPRRWNYKLLKGWRLSEIAPASKVRLSYALTYGGIVRTAKKKADVFWANPGGIGFLGDTSPDPDKTYAAPQIESPDSVSVKIDTQCAPVGMSAVSARQFDRLQYAGTYDTHWREKIAPHIPLDLDMAFWNVAPRDQIVKGFLKGGETVSTTGIFPTQDGMLEFLLPNYVAQAVCLRDGRPEHSMMMDLDTVIIDADTRDVTLRWQTIVEKHDGYDEYEIIAVEKQKQAG